MECLLMSECRRGTQASTIASAFQSLLENPLWPTSHCELWGSQLYLYPNWPLTLTFSLTISQRYIELKTKITMKPCHFQSIWPFHYPPEFEIILPFLNISLYFSSHFTFLMFVKICYRTPIHALMLILYIALVHAFFQAAPLNRYSSVENSGICWFNLYSSFHYPHKLLINLFWLYGFWPTGTFQTYFGFYSISSFIA